MNQKDIKKYFLSIDWFVLILLVMIFITSLFVLIKTTADPFTGNEAGMSAIIDKLNMYYPRQHVFFFVTGLLWIFILCFVDFHILDRVTNIAYLFFVVMLIAVKLFAATTRGVTGWFYIGSFGIQPAEYAKLAVILVLARYASKEVDMHDRLKINKEFWKAILMILVYVALVVLQPDYGTAFVYLVILLGMLVAGRLSWKTMLFFFVMLMAVVALLFFTGLMPEHARMRILVFFDLNTPEVIEVLGIDPNVLTKYDSTQVDTAKTIFATAGLWGKGFFSDNSMAQLRYLMEARTDFIFSSAVETMGFMGGLWIIFLYLILFARCLYLAFRSRDNYGFFIIVGVVCMMVAHVFENIGMNIGFMPVTGIPLPFFSYGGSNMWTNMLAIGLVLMVNMNRTNKRFKSHLAPESLG